MSPSPPRLLRCQPGWIGTEPGHWMRLRINTLFELDDGPGRGGKPSAPAELTLIYLKSYEQMVWEQSSQPP